MAAPVPGKNSFTEAEAKKRLESFGYTNISALREDAQSIWRGTAMKSGQQMPVALDYQGNIVAR
jgi:putative membrane protein